MSAKTEYLKQMAQEKLSCVHEQIEKAKEDLDSSLGETKSKVESKIVKVKADLKDKKTQAEMKRSRLGAEARKGKEALETKVVELKEKIEMKVKSKNEDKVKKKAVHNAEKAECYAELCMDCASVAIVEAELACLEACKARVEAEELVGAGA